MLSNISNMKRQITPSVAMKFNVLDTGGDTHGTCVTANESETMKPHKRSRYSTELLGALDLAGNLLRRGVVSSMCGDSGSIAIMKLFTAVRRQW